MTDITNLPQDTTLKDLAAGKWLATVSDNTNTMPNQIPPEIQQYITSLLQEAGKSNLSQEELTSATNDMYHRIETFLIDKLVENLPETKLEEFTNLSEQATDATVLQQYLQQNIPNVQDVFAKAFEDFRTTYIQQAKSTPQQ